MESQQVNGVPVDGISSIVDGTNEHQIQGTEDAEKMQEAYKNNLKAHRQGISPSEVIKAYNVWHDYDKDLCPGVYNGPSIAAETLASFHPDPEERAILHILDVAAGTGRVGVELASRGFKKFDALEPAQQMRDQCADRGLYQFLCSDLIGDTPTSLVSGQYDVVLTAGGMGEGHIPVRGLDEMARLLKSGGKLIVVMREEYLSTVPEYVDKLEPRLQYLVDTGKLVKVTLSK